MPREGYAPRQPRINDSHLRRSLSQKGCGGVQISLTKNATAADGGKAMGFGSFHAYNVSSVSLSHSRRVIDALYPL